MRMINGVPRTSIENELRSMCEVLQEVTENRNTDWRDVLYVGVNQIEFEKLLAVITWEFNFGEDMAYDNRDDAALHDLEEAPEGILFAASNADWMEATIYGRVPFSRWLCAVLEIPANPNAPEKYCPDLLPEPITTTPRTFSRTIKASEVEVMDRELTYPANSVRPHTSETVDQILRAAYVRQELAFLPDKTKSLYPGVFGYEGDDISW